MNSNVSIEEQRVRPAWVEDLTTFYQGRIARQFVLHFNITDYVIDTSMHEPGSGSNRRFGDVVGSQLLSMQDYLHGFLFSVLGCQSIYTYSLANGLTAEDMPEAGNMSTQSHYSMERIYEIQRFLRIGATRRLTPVKESENELPQEISENLKLLGQLLRTNQYTSADTTAEEKPIAVILEYAEKLLPFHLGQGQGEREQLQVLEIVQRWALDPAIRQTSNLIILLTTNIGEIPSNVYAEGSDCRSIRVPLPEEGEREAFIRFKMTRAPRPRLAPLSAEDFGPSPQDQARLLARATQGMRLTDIDNMSRRISVEFYKRKNELGDQSNSTPLLKMEDIQSTKAEVIKAQSAQLLEIVPPVRGFNEIGGMESLKRYLQRRAKLMLNNQQSPLVPSGLLLAGPPGTGKTMIAEALATESGFNLVKMRSIQDKWVGSSERNLELVMNLLKDLHPVVVFIDEIDQAMVRRDTGQSGDGGVGARMFARVLEEMSNPANRGRILWVAATNRADIIDDALLRRFDRVVPLLTPDIGESCRIFATMLHTIMKQSNSNVKVSYGGDMAQSGNLDTSGRPDPTQKDFNAFLPVAEITTELGLTGASIEIVVRRAVEIAYEEIIDMHGGEGQVPTIKKQHLLQAVRDFKPNHNRTMYDYQSLLALRACNFHSVIPNLPKSGVYARIQREDGTIDIERLEQEIQVIEREHRLNQY